MKKVKLFTEEEKEKLKLRIKDYENLSFYQTMKAKFFAEIDCINKTIHAMSCEQVEEFQKIAQKRIAQLENYKKDLVENLGFVFGYNGEWICEDNYLIINLKIF